MLCEKEELVTIQRMHFCPSCLALCWYNENILTLHDGIVDEPSYPWCFAVADEFFSRAISQRFLRNPVWYLKTVSHCGRASGPSSFAARLGLDWRSLKHAGVINHPFDAATWILGEGEGAGRPKK